MLANLSRRQSLKGLALFGLGASVAAPLLAKPALAQPAPSDIKDEDIFQFALNLEYMEAEYYLRATTGKGIDAADAGSNAGDVKGGHKVKFHSKDIQPAPEWKMVHFHRSAMPQDQVRCVAFGQSAARRTDDAGVKGGLPDPRHIS